jgi:enoyl-CoA hydratase/carnithine racemase
MSDSGRSSSQEDDVPDLSVQGAIATIRFRRPAHANRLGPDDLRVLRDHLEAVDRDERILVLRFCGEGKYFCSGYDISKLSSEAAPRSLYFGETIDQVEQARPVTIAAVHGGVYGGGTDLALACDFRMGSPGANMFMPAVRLGLHFYPRGLARYVSRLGLDQAKRLFLTAQRLEAEEMLRIGFLTDLVPADQLEGCVEDRCRLLAGMAPQALVGTKKHLNLIASGTLDVAAIEAAVRRSEASSDIREGARAWKEKRAPVFTGD